MERGRRVVPFFPIPFKRDGVDAVKENDEGESLKVQVEKRRISQEIFIQPEEIFQYLQVLKKSLGFYRGRPTSL